MATARPGTPRPEPPATESRTGTAGLHQAPSRRPLATKIPMVPHGEPPTTDIPTVTRGEPPATKIPMVTHGEPPATDIPTVTRGEPPATKIPMVTHGEPPATDIPTVTRGEPPATDIPTVTHGEPPATKIPMATHGEPPATEIPMVPHGEPPATKVPMVTHGEPPATKIPLVTRGEPPATDIPTVTHGEPPATDIPTVTRGEPPATDIPTVTHGEPPATEIPPEALAVMADLRRLTRRVAREDWREPSAGRRLPPLLAALTRRTEDDARLRQLRGLRLPATPQRGALPPPWPPSPRLLLQPSTAAPRTPPGRAFAEGVALRLQPPLCHDGEEDTMPELLGVRELYRELVRALPAERLRFHREPLVEPAATAADLLPTGERGRRNAGELPRRGDAQRQTTCLFDGYLRYVAATGSDFLRAIFHLRGGDGSEEEEDEEPAGAPGPCQEPAPAPAEPYEKGLWKPALPVPVPVGLERLQRRLGRLWAALGVPDRERLEMAVKYGAGGALARLPAALEAWEAAAGGILRREWLLARLERLEEHGSDPGRFFRKGPVTAGRRAGEARARGRLRAALARCEARLAAALRCLRDGFGDAVTFRGRPYGEKMRRDTVEMLYRLQQRRRAGALQAALGGQPRPPPPSPAGAETPGGQ